MTLRDRIRTAPEGAQVCILYRCGTPGETTGGEDIYSIEELRELVRDEDEDELFIPSRAQLLASVRNHRHYF